MFGHGKYIYNNNTKGDDNMKRISVILLLIIMMLFLSACDDFSRNVDGVHYTTICRPVDTDYSLVEMKDANEENLIDEEVVVAIYGDYEYFFESKTVYDFYLVQLGGIKGEYYSILDAIEEDQNVIDFLFDECPYLDDNEIINKRIYGE